MLKIKKKTYSTIFTRMKNVFFFQLAFGIAKILNLERNVQFGLLCVACVPGGGFGHVAVIVSKSDLPLSVTMNLINIVAMLGKLS